MRSLVILGCTGSIGRQALEVCRTYPGILRVTGLAANRWSETFRQQVAAWAPEVIALGSLEGAREARRDFGGSGVTILEGEDGLRELATWPGVDTVLVSTSGTVSIIPTLEALRLGRRVALANKETLVVAGDLVMAEARQSGELLPVDSEHAAIHQCLRGEKSEDVGRLLLTASGGPFRMLSTEELELVTPEQALAHPVWRMGPKVTVDSATLMNKGLEVIEAHHLFGIPYDRISVLIHPQGLVHSLVEMRDGVMLAQMGPPDMRLPIAYALLYPNRPLLSWERIDLVRAGQLTFEEPRWDVFPCLQYAYQAGRIGGTMPAVMSAADEVAVDRFLRRELSFPGIAGLVRRVMEEHAAEPVHSVQDVLEVSNWARRRAAELTAE